MRINAHTRIAHGHRDLSRRQGFGLKHDFAVAKPACSGLDCIHDQVQKNLLELNRVTLDLGEVSGQVQPKRNAMAGDLRADQIECLPDDVVQVDRPESRRSFLHQGPDSVEHVTRTFALQRRCARLRHLPLPDRECLAPANGRTHSHSSPRPRAAV